MDIPVWKKPVTPKDRDDLRVIANTFRWNAREQARVKRGVAEDSLCLMLFENDLVREVPWPAISRAVSMGWIAKTKIAHRGGAHRNVFVYFGRSCLPRTRLGRLVRRVKSWLGINVEGPATLR